MRPDERSISGHFKSLIKTPVPPIGHFESVSSGIRQSGGDIAQTLSEWQDEGVKCYVLDIDGDDISDTTIEGNVDSSSQMTCYLIWIGRISGVRFRFPSGKHGYRGTLA